MKRFMAVLLMAALVSGGSISVLAVDAEEENAESEEIVEAEIFSEVDANGLIWELTDGTLTISGNGVIEKNTLFISDAEQRDKVFSIIIEEGVSEIGREAFAEFHNLEKVFLPDSLTKIGDWSFYKCINLPEIIIPASVSDIGEGAFMYCGIKAISLPVGMKEIKNSTFSCCWELTELIIPNGVIKIGDEAFYASGISSISIPDSITEIGERAFAQSSLLDVLIPGSVKNIGYGAFWICSELKSVTFKGDAPDISVGKGEYKALFEGVTATAYYPAGNPTYTEEVKAAYGTGLTWVAKEMPKMSFTDVTDADWYYDAADFVFSRGIMIGMNDTEFGPSVKLSRAQFATILYRMEGEPEVAYDAAAFPDVTDGQFYTKAAMWAKSSGVISGYEDGRFGPADEITREQMAVMMYRYADKLGLDISAEGDMSGFPDAERISPFANKEVKWTVGEGLIKGDGGNINPQGTAERAQCATIIMRFMEGYGL